MKSSPPFRWHFVYITQDIGTAQLRQQDYAFDRMIYVVGNEQNYHFKVLALFWINLVLHGQRIYTISRMVWSNCPKVK